MCRQRRPHDPVHAVEVDVQLVLAAAAHRIHLEADRPGRQPALHGVRDVAPGRERRAPVGDSAGTLKHRRLDPRYAVGGHHDHVGALARDAQHRRSGALAVAEVDRQAGKAPARGLLGEHAALQRHPEHVPHRIGRDGGRHRGECEQCRDGSNRRMISVHGPRQRLCYRQVRASPYAPAVSAMLRGSDAEIGHAVARRGAARGLGSGDPHRRRHPGADRSSAGRDRQPRASSGAPPTRWPACS